MRMFKAHIFIFTPAFRCFRVLSITTNSVHISYIFVSIDMDVVLLHAEKCYKLNVSHISISHATPMFRTFKMKKEPNEKHDGNNMGHCYRYLYALNHAWYGA